MNPTKYDQHKKIIATLCYIQEDGKTLMLYRNKKENDIHEGKYNGLGGKSEFGENPYECVIREIKEEAGIDIKPTYVGCITFKEFTPNNDWEVHIFTADRYFGDLIECNEGDLEWIANEKIMDLPMWEGDYYFLEKIMRKDPFFFGTYIYEDKELKNHYFNEIKVSK